MMKAWSKAIAKSAAEFPIQPLPILTGHIPQPLRGTLYRNGPGRLERGNMRVGHWFDGDGAILAVRFTEGGATATYRYVQTEGYQQETAAERYLFPNYGMTAPGFFWNSWGKDAKNAANTSVLALPEKLLALWEGGFPHALDLATLETQGLDRLSSLTLGQPYSAHPKIDPKTGDIYNFGISAGLNASLNLYQSDSTGRIEKKTTFALQGLPLVHDFVIAGSYLIFFVPPVRVNLMPAILGFLSFSEAMQWKPELGTQVLIFDRHTLLPVSQFQAEPWFQWHYSNGSTDRDGNLEIEFVRYPDFQTNQNLKEVATGEIHTPAKGILVRICLDPKTAKLIASEPVGDRGCDFPVVPAHQTGQPWRYTYLAVHRDGADLSAEIFGAIARYDRQTGKLAMADMGQSNYPSEPIFVPNAAHSEQGWVLTVVYDGSSNRSEVRIYDSEKLEAEPVCRLGLPSVIPPSFHGTWQPQNND